MFFNSNKVFNLEWKNKNTRYQNQDEPELMKSVYFYNNRYVNEYMCVVWVESWGREPRFSVLFSDNMLLPVFGGVTGTWCHLKPFAK